jgi:hypothetical protein
MSEKKMVRRSVAIALGIICIILVTALGAVTYMGYSPTTTNSVTSLQNQINQLQDTYNNYVASHHHTDAEYDSLQSTYNSYVSTHGHSDSEYDALQNQVSDLTSALNLGKSRVWISSQTASSPYNSYYSWAPLSVDYAGYVSVNVESSTSTHTYVHAIYSAYGVHYDQWIDVGKSGTAVFPVLPTSSMGIYVGAHYEASTVTVTITYYY